MYYDSMGKGYGQIFDFVGNHVGNWLEQAAKAGSNTPTVQMTPQQRALYERRYGKKPPAPKTTPPKATPVAPKPVRQSGKNYKGTGGVEYDYKTGQAIDPKTGKVSPGGYSIDPKTGGRTNYKPGESRNGGGTGRSTLCD